MEVKALTVPTHRLVLCEPSMCNAVISDGLFEGSVCQKMDSKIALTNMMSTVPSPPALFSPLEVIGILDLCS